MDSSKSKITNTTRSSQLDSPNKSTMMRTGDKSAKSTALQKKQQPQVLKKQPISTQKKVSQRFNTKTLNQSQLENQNILSNQQEQKKKNNGSSQGLWYYDRQANSISQYWDKLESQNRINKWNNQFIRVDLDKAVQSQANSVRNSMTREDGATRKQNQRPQSSFSSFREEVGKHCINEEDSQRGESPKQRINLNNTLLDHGSPRSQLSQKQQSRFTYSQIQMKADEQCLNECDPQLVNTYYQKTQNQNITNEAQEVFSGKKESRFNISRRSADGIGASTSKVQNKVDSNFKYFVSQITTIPGPQKTQSGSEMIEGLKSERRDQMVFADETFKLRNQCFYGSYYQQSDTKYHQVFTPNKDYKAYVKSLKDNVNRKTTQDAIQKRNELYYKETQIY